MAHPMTIPDLDIIYGSITATAGTAAALTCNDPSCTLTRTATGDYTVNIGAAFLSAPVVTASLVDATYATNKAQAVVVQTVATNSVRFNLSELSLGGATTTILQALADGGDITFTAIGRRNF